MKVYNSIYNVKLSTIDNSSPLLRANGFDVISDNLN